VVMNTAAALVAAGVSENFRDAAELARGAIDSGRACETLDTLRTFTSST
jgi:anthranilate phosphoribosyltransferase